MAFLCGVVVGIMLCPLLYRAVLMLLLWSNPGWTDDDWRSVVGDDMRPSEPSDSLD